MAPVDDGSAKMSRKLQGKEAGTGSKCGSVRARVREGFAAF